MIENFWVGAILFSIGTAGVLILAWTWPLSFLSKLLCTVLLVIFYIFCWTKIIHPNVLPLRAYGTSWPRPTGLTGSNFAGIFWREYFTEIELQISNQSDYDYDGLDFSIDSDEQLVSIGQNSGELPCAFIKQSSVGPVSRVRCGVLPKHSVSNLILAFINRPRPDDDIKPHPLPGRIPKYVNLSGEYVAAHRAIKVNLKVDIAKPGLFK